MKILVSNLSEEADENHLKELFGAYGPLNSVKVVRGGEGNRSRGLAMVEMSNRSDGEKAISDLNRYVYMNQYLVVSEMKQASYQHVQQSPLDGNS
jgi:RNA recognition motif-containing protein